MLAICNYMFCTLSSQLKHFLIQCSFASRVLDFKSVKKIYFDFLSVSHLSFLFIQCLRFVFIGVFFMRFVRFPLCSFSVSSGWRCRRHREPCLCSSMETFHFCPTTPSLQTSSCSRFVCTWIKEYLLCFLWLDFKKCFRIKEESTEMYQP